MEETLDRRFLDYSARKLQELRSRIETCLGTLNEDEIWARGTGNENAVGNLVLHLCGNVRQWIVSGVGGKPDVRDRDGEFAALGGFSVLDLTERLRAAVEGAVAALTGVTAERLAQRIVVQHYDVTVMEAIYHVVEHFSMHTGQIIYITKLLTGSDLGFYRHLRTPAPHGQTTP